MERGPAALPAFCVTTVPYGRALVVTPVYIGWVFENVLIDPPTQYTRRETKA